MSAFAAVFRILPVLSLLSLMSVRLVCCLRRELDFAGHADALEIPLLLSSDAIVADVELGQGPHIGDGVGKRDYT
jgi:hypothetical protein